MRPAPLDLPVPLLGFSKAHIDPANAQKFAQLAPFISTLMAIYDGKAIWTG